jgi:hypothetical protein
MVSKLTPPSVDFPVLPGLCCYSTCTIVPLQLSWWFLLSHVVTRATHTALEMKVFLRCTWLQLEMLCFTIAAWVSLFHPPEYCLFTDLCLKEDSSLVSSSPKCALLTKILYRFLSYPTQSTASPPITVRACCVYWVYLKEAVVRCGLRLSVQTFYCL